MTTNNFLHDDYLSKIDQIIMRYPLKKRWPLSYTYVMHRNALNSPKGTVVWKSIHRRIGRALEKLEVEVDQELNNEDQCFENLLLFCVATINAVADRGVFNDHRTAQDQVQERYRQCLKDLEQMNDNTEN